MIAYKNCDTPPRQYTIALSTNPVDPTQFAFLFSMTYFSSNDVLYILNLPQPATSLFEVRNLAFSHALSTVVIGGVTINQGSFFAGALWIEGDFICSVKLGMSNAGAQIEADVGDISISGGTFLVKDTHLSLIYTTSQQTFGLSGKVVWLNNLVSLSINIGRGPFGYQLTGSTTILIGGVRFSIALTKVAGTTMFDTQLIIAGGNEDNTWLNDFPFNTIESFRFTAGAAITGVTLAVEIGVNGQTYALSMDAGVASNLKPYLQSIVECGLGKFKPASETCQSCPAGTYQPGFFKTQSSDCIKCPAGTYSSNVGAISSLTCTICGMGKYSTAEGSTSCQSCEKGTWSDALQGTSSSVCRLCPKGTYSSNIAAISSLTCTACLSGQFSNTLGASSCTKCRQGTYQPLPGSTSCICCGKGWWAKNTGHVLCEICVFSNDLGCKGDDDGNCGLGMNCDSPCANSN